MAQLATAQVVPAGVAGGDDIPMAVVSQPAMQLMQVICPPNMSPVRARVHARVRVGSDPVSPRVCGGRE